MKHNSMIKRVLAITLMFSMCCALVPAHTQAAKVKVKKVSVTKPSDGVIVLKKGKTYKLKATVSVTPNKSANKKVVYKSSKKKVATVSKTGKIVAKKAGTTYITITSTKNKKKKAKVKVIVGQPVTKVKLTKSSLELIKGDEVMLEASVLPKKASVKGVKFVSSNKKVATVTSKGYLVAKGIGSTKITATAKDGSNKKATCNVTVSPSELTFADYDAMNWAWKTSSKLKTKYQNDFYMGVGLNAGQLMNPGQANSYARYHFNSLSMTNEMKVNSIFDGVATDELLQEKGIDDPQINTYRLDKYLSYARDNGFKVRFHTLVWHQQTPQPFFTKNYNGGIKDEDLVDRETMNARLEKYITHVIDYCETNYPGVIYAYDVVNEAYHIDKNTDTLNQWYRIYVKKDSNNNIIPNSYYEYIVNAFKYAKAAITKNHSSAKLYYNDYNTFDCDDALLNLINNYVNKDAKNCDGIGMQSHLGMSYPSMSTYQSTIRKFANAGLDVQVTELDIGVTASSVGGVKLYEGAEKDKLFYNQAVRYKEVIKTLQANADKVSSVTVWGLGDESTNWKTYEYPTLFYPNMSKLKPAFFGILQDSSIGDTYK